jgi:hypothetical protein
MSHKMGAEKACWSYASSHWYVAGDFSIDTPLFEGNPGNCLS